MVTKKAFTLIEMLIAITILTLVIGSATGLFVSAVRSQAKALAFQKLLDETSYVMEYMSRALRMAKKELGNFPNTCLTTEKDNYETNLGNDKVRFINYDDKCQEFFKDGTQLKERKSTNELAANFQAPLELTSSGLKTSSLKFNLSGEGQGDSLQPRVTILMTIKKAGITGPEIKIQTTISQRNLDVRQ